MIVELTRDFMFKLYAELPPNEELDEAAKARR